MNKTIHNIYNMSQFCVSSYFCWITSPHNTTTLQHYTTTHISFMYTLAATTRSILSNSSELGPMCLFRNELCDLMSLLTLVFSPCTNCGCFLCSFWDAAVVCMRRAWSSRQWRHVSILADPLLSSAAISAVVIAGVYASATELTLGKWTD